MADKATRADWEAIEVDYRAGIKTLRQIAEGHGITEGAIRKRAKRDEWERDLSAKITAKADALVRKAEVRKLVRSELPTERETIEIGAQALAHVVEGQKGTVTSRRELGDRLFGELNAVTTQLGEFEQLGEMMASPDENGADKLNELYRKVMGLPSRIDTFKKLVDTDKALIELQRKVWRIKDDTSLEDISKKFGDGVAMSAMEAYSRLCNDPSSS